MPKESMKRPGVILPKREKRKRMDESTFDLMDCSAVETMSYGDFKTLVKAILRGVLSKRDFREAQENDDFCSSILNSFKIMFTSSSFGHSHQFKTFFSIRITFLKITNTKRHQGSLSCSTFDPQ